MNSRSRSRKLKYQQTLLREEAYRYNKQKSLLPVLLILAIFSLLFIIFYITTSGVGKTVQTVSGEQQSKTIKIEKSGLYSLNFKNVLNPLFKASSKSIKSEIIIKKEGKKLYHYFIDDPSSNSIENQKVNYFFREPGNYTIQSIHHANELTADVGSVLKSSMLSIKKRKGNNRLLVWGMRLFILSIIIILLLKDYFGNPKNYKKIIENKEINWKAKSLAPLFIAASIWLAAGYFVAQSGYGFAGYGDDMHEPAKKVQIEYNYYVN